MQEAFSPGVNVNAKPFTPTTAQGARTRSPVVDAVLTQSARLSERVAEAGDLSGLAPDVRMSFMRQAQIESIYGLGDFDSDYEPAEPAVNDAPCYPGGGAGSSTTRRREHSELDSRGGRRPRRRPGERRRRRGRGEPQEAGRAGHGRVGRRGDPETGRGSSGDRGGAMHDCEDYNRDRGCGRAASYRRRDDRGGEVVAVLRAARGAGGGGCRLAMRLLRADATEIRAAPGLRPARSRHLPQLFQPRPYWDHNQVAGAGRLAGGRVRISSGGSQNHGARN